jgi:hypothetical protein
MFIFLFCSACWQEAITPPPPQKQELIVEPVYVPKEKINVAPVIRSLVLLTSDPTTKDSIRVKPTGFDAENERIRYRYMWKVNEKDIRTEGRAVFPAHRHKKGDVVRVDVFASDGTNESASSSLSIEIQNSPPTWMEESRSIKKIDGHQLQAQDPDKDPIVYSLEGAPQGMSIDEQSNILTYKGSTTAKKGPYDIHILATDPEGAFVKWSFSITVK